MQKRGFTLAEILISVGIVGVIAAIMLPMANKYKPDENKVKYLQAYNSLMEVLPAIVNNRNAYPVVNPVNDENEEVFEYNLTPLANTSAPVMIDGKQYSGKAKFCRLLATGFNTTGELNCSGTYVDYGTNGPSDEAFANPSFTTNNGTQYFIQTNDEGGYVSDIFIDVNGAEGPNCFATSDACKMADRFKFTVSKEGQINVEDPLGKEYIATSTNWKLNRELYAKLDTTEGLTKTLKEDTKPNPPSEPEPVPPPPPPPPPPPEPDPVPPPPPPEPVPPPPPPEPDPVPPPPPPEPDPEPVPKPVPKPAAIDTNFIANMYDPGSIGYYEGTPQADFATSFAIVTESYGIQQSTGLLGNNYSIICVDISTSDTIQDVINKFNAIDGVTAEYVKDPYTGERYIQFTGGFLTANAPNIGYGNYGVEYNESNGPSGPTDYKIVRINLNPEVQYCTAGETYYGKKDQ